LSKHKKASLLNTTLLLVKQFSHLYDKDDGMEEALCFLSYLDFANHKHSWKPVELVCSGRINLLAI
jgi:hypothetical protein